MRSIENYKGSIYTIEVITITSTIRLDRVFSKRVMVDHPELVVPGWDSEPFFYGVYAHTSRGIAGPVELFGNRETARAAARWRYDNKPDHASGMMKPLRLTPDDKIRIDEVTEDELLHKWWDLHG